MIAQPNGGNKRCGGCCRKGSECPRCERRREEGNAERRRLYLLHCHRPPALTTEQQAEIDRRVEAYAADVEAGRDIEYFQWEE